MDTDTICVVCVYLATKISENKEWQRKLVATLFAYIKYLYLIRLALFLYEYDLKAFVTYVNYSATSNRAS